MLSDHVRVGTCPKVHFLNYRLDLERNGYKILSTEEQDENVVFTYEKVIKVSQPIMKRTNQS